MERCEKPLAPVCEDCTLLVRSEEKPSGWEDVGWDMGGNIGVHTSGFILPQANTANGEE